MVTIEAGMKFKKETLLFDEIIIEVKLSNPKITTFELLFTFINKKTKEIHGEGKQKIGFVDANHKVIPIPFELIKEGKNYL